MLKPQSIYKSIYWKPGHLEYLYMYLVCIYLSDLTKLMHLQSKYICSKSLLNSEDKINNLLHIYSTPNIWGWKLLLPFDMFPISFSIKNNTLRGPPRKILQLHVEKMVKCQNILMKYCTQKIIAFLSEYFA